MRVPEGTLQALGHSVTVHQAGQHTREGHRGLRANWDTAGMPGRVPGGSRWDELHRQDNSWVYAGRTGLQGGVNNTAERRAPNQG